MGGIGAVYAGYDGLNRQLWRNTTNSPTGAYVTYTYDETTAHGYGIGRLTSESFTGGDAGQPLHGSYSYYYGARGEITNFTLTTTENASYSLAYGYNDAGQQTSLTYSDGEVFTTPYNNEDWLAGATTTPSGGSQVNLLTNVTYTGVAGAAGHITSANLANGTYALSASYDNDLRFTNLTLTNVSLGTTVFGTQRTYDNVGNVIGVNTTLANGTDNQAFCYDSVNRLYWAGSTGTPSCGWSLTPGTLSSANYTATYSYDATNRITGGSLGTLSYTDSAHVHGATSSTSGETATYDAAGDMQCRAPTSAVTCAGTTPTGASLTYDAERRLSHWQNAQSTPTSQAWYLYDGSGQRVEQYVSGGSGNHTYYLPGGVEEVTPSGTLIKYYSAGGMALGVNTTHDASGIAYLASDGLGSVSEALSPTGIVTGAQLYSPYGGVRYATGTMPTAKGFTGQYADASTGLDYYGARYYDPSLGQFTSADTANDGINRYGYVKGNPETATDPTGHRMVGDSDPLIMSFQAQSILDTAAGGLFTLGRQSTETYAKYLSRPSGMMRRQPWESGRGFGPNESPYSTYRLSGTTEEIENAAAKIRFFKAGAKVAGVLGAISDGVLAGIDYYGRDTKDSGDQGLRIEKSVIYGTAHAVIVTGMAIAAASIVGALPVIGETGIAEVVAGAAGGALGGTIADHVLTPTVVDTVTNAVNSGASFVNNVVSAVNTISNPFSVFHF